jgi:hypothetical protein
MKIGLEKIANEDQTEVIQPEEKESSTAVICRSDCQYSQNPEKMCMLKTIALAEVEEGKFACAQYSPVQQMMEQAGMGQDQGAAQSGRQIGLAGAKTKQ